MCRYNSFQIDDQMNIAKLPQPNTVMITLSHHRFKVFLFRAKKELCINNAEVYRDLFINEKPDFSELFSPQKA